MPKQSLFLIFPLFAVTLSAQQTNLSGIVTYHNSKFETGKTIPVQNATVEEAYESKFSTLTKADGAFKMVLVGIENGKSISLNATKNDEDLEVVNTDRLQAVAGQKAPIKIYMASRKKLAEARREYYRIGKTEAEKVLNARYKKAQEELSALQEKAEGNETRIAELQKELTALMTDSKKIEDYAKDLAERYVKVNLDDASALYVEAFRQFQKGNLKEALAILQRADLAGQAEKIWDEEKKISNLRKEATRRELAKDSVKKEVMLALRLKADLHKAELQWDSVEATYELLVRLDSNAVNNLETFASFLQSQNQITRSVYYFEKCLHFDLTEPRKAAICHNLGNAYSVVNQMQEAEKNFLQSLDIYERLAKNNSREYEPELAGTMSDMANLYRDLQMMPQAEKLYLGSVEILERFTRGDSIQFEPALAKSIMNLGNFYWMNNKISEAERMYLRSLTINERLAKNDVAQFESEFALTIMNLGNLYLHVNKVQEALKMYMSSFDIYEHLAKNNPARFEPYLAKSAMNLGNIYSTVQNVSEAERMYLRSQKIYERLSQNDSAQFEPEFALAMMNLGVFYSTVQRITESEKMFVRSMAIYERLANSNPSQYDPRLALVALNLGIFYHKLQRLPESEKVLLTALNTYERLAKYNSEQFDPGLANTAMNLGILYYYTQRMPESEQMYQRALNIYERLAKSNSLQFEPALAEVAVNLAIFYHDFQKMPESEKMYLYAQDIYERLIKNNSVQFEPGLASTLDNFGYHCQKNQQFDRARPLFSRALFLRQKALINGQIYQKEDFNIVLIDMSDLRDSFTIHGEHLIAAAIQHERTASLDSLRLVDSSFLAQVPLEYDTLARCYLLARDFPAAEAAARRGLALDPLQVQINSHLAAALLLQGKDKEAKILYQSLANQSHQSDRATDSPSVASSCDRCRRDIEALQAAGAASARDVRRVKGWLR